MESAVPPIIDLTEARGVFSNRWCFTFNNYTELEYDGLCLWLGVNAKTAIVAREGGTVETPTRHLQGAMVLKKRYRLVSLKIVMPRAHFEVMRARDNASAFDYCRKEDPNPFLVGFPPPLLVLKLSELYPWQKAVLGWVTDRSNRGDREILWIWEPVGNVGKSALVRHLIIVSNAVLIGGKKGDVFYHFSQQLKAKLDVPIVVLDLSRTIEEYVSYESLECLKNGYFVCGKYESCQCVFNPPTIVVFANFCPQRTKMSLDRWRIYEVSECALMLGPDLFCMESPMEVENTMAAVDIGITF